MTGPEPRADPMIGALERLTLAERVGRDLIAMIEARRMRPGDELPPEGDLAASFGVSRPVVREALAQLRSLGLVTVRSGRPATVREIDSLLPRAFFQSSIAMRDTEARELFEVRTCLEVQSASLAAKRATDEDIDRMRAALEPMARAIAEGRYGDFVDLDVALHLAISRASGNLMLHHLIEGIEEPLRESIRLGLVSREASTELTRLAAVHHDIVAAIAARDPAAAASAMLAHFTEAIAAVRRARQ